MKIQRLYAIMIYLLNHKRATARELAEHFEVSLRTIQRDMEALCLAGIPVISVAGAAGGYEISEYFKLNEQLATSDDYSCLLTALQGLVSATNDPKAKRILEQILLLSKQEDQSILLDFSVLQERDTGSLQTLQSAIARKQTVRFTYTNNNNETRSHSVEPVAVLYRWYAWYLLAYSTIKEDYRTYKLVRMRDLEITDIPFSREHEPAGTILLKTDRTDSRKYLSVLVRCRKDAIPRVTEYLSGRILELAENGDALMELKVVENEQLWIGTLLSLGGNVHILAPERVRSRLLKAAEEIVSLYGKL